MKTGCDIGIDEVGRGAWAGPLLVVAARLRPNQSLPAGLMDSKKLSVSQRHKMASVLKSACQFGEGWVWPDEINKLKLSQAMRLASRRALRKLSAGDHEAIIFDGKVNYCPDSYRNVSCQIRADNQVGLVSAAAIWAKVRRDGYMISLSARHHQYGFAEHKGYGTKKHLENLVKHRAGSQHRVFYKPVARLLKP